MHKAWSSFSITDVGKKRSVNQDAIYINDEQQIWLVADGMGGHRDGDKASKAIVAAFEQSHFNDNLSDRIVLIEQVMRQLNDELQLYSKEVLNGQHIGSTMICMTVCQGIAAVVWTGDSRCYRIKQERIQQISWDHSYIEEMLRSGHIFPEEAAASKLSNVITRAVGAHESLFFDHALLPYCEDDVFLLCSDGLTAELNDTEIFNSVIKHGCSQAGLDDLFQQTLARGARDNVSIALIKNNQRRSIARDEISLVARFSQSINQLAEKLTNGQLNLADYYLQLQSLVNQSVAAYSQFKGLRTQELPAIQDPTISGAKMDTASYPLVNEQSRFKFDWVYLCFIVSISAIALAIFYLFLQ